MFTSLTDKNLNFFSEPIHSPTCCKKCWSYIVLGLLIDGAKKYKRRPILIAIIFEIIPSIRILIYLLVHNLKLITELSLKKHPHNLWCIHRDKQMPLIEIWLWNSIFNIWTILMANKEKYESNSQANKGKKVK